MLVPWVPDSRTNTRERQRNRKLERERDREKKNEKVDLRVSWASDLSDTIDQSHDFLEIPVSTCTDG